MDGYEKNYTTVWNGNYQSSLKGEYSKIIEPTGDAYINNDTWTTCKEPIRNLWVSITRTKETP
jgi:hypothetical protein